MPFLVVFITLNTHMKKIVPVGIIIAVVVLGAAYMEKSKIHRLFNKVMGTPATQMVATPTASPAPGAMVPSANIFLTKVDKVKGVYLTDFAGMTLYTYKKDTAGKSTCTDSCLTIWPAYSSGATAQKTFPTGISVITRDDGSKQFAWKGMPLYYYAKDVKPGDTMGDGVGKVWQIVAP